MSFEFKVVCARNPEVPQLDFTCPHEGFARRPDARCVPASVTGGLLRMNEGMTFKIARQSRHTRCCAYRAVSGRRPVCSQPGAQLVTGLGASRCACSA